VAAAQIRVALRSVRGKLAVYPAAPMILVSGWAITRYAVRKVPFLEAVTPEGHFIVWFGALIVLLSLEPILFNQFASDRGGLTLQFLAPLSDRELVLGKALASAALIGLSLAPVIVAAIILAPRGSPLAWAAALAGCASIAILFIPIATILSAVLPKPADLNRMGTAGNAHALATFLGFVLTFALATPPILLGAVGTLFLGPGGTLALSLGWMLAMALASWPLFLGATRLVGERRESLALAAQER
jgi:hypothetical protein